jgi:hypothetical protein
MAEPGASPPDSAPWADETTSRGHLATWVVVGAVLVALVALAGIVAAVWPAAAPPRGAPPADPVPPPGSTAPAAPTAQPRWTGLPTGCPVLTTTQEGVDNETGEGTPVGVRTADTMLTSQVCSWAAGALPGARVRATVSVYLTGNGDATRRFTDERAAAGRFPAVVTVLDEQSEWDQAFVRVDVILRTLTLVTRSGNAVVQVTVPVRDPLLPRDTRDRVVDRYRRAAHAIAAEVVDDLR